MADENENFSTSLFTSSRGGRKNDPEEEKRKSQYNAISEEKLELIEHESHRAERSAQQQRAYEIALKAQENRKKMQTYATLIALATLAGSFFFLGRGGSLISTIFDYLRSFFSSSAPIAPPLPVA